MVLYERKRMNKPTIIHDTHESSEKQGGIGAVIRGVLSSEPLNEFDQIVMGIAIGVVSSIIAVRKYIKI